MRPAYRPRRRRFRKLYPRGAGLRVRCRSRLMLLLSDRLLMRERHLLRSIDRLVELDGLRQEFAPFCSGNPGILVQQWHILRWPQMRRWRMGWDSNPRGACTPAGFQDRCLQPLGHPSIRSIKYLVRLRHRSKRRSPSDRRLLERPGRAALDHPAFRQNTELAK